MVLALTAKAVDMPGILSTDWVIVGLLNDDTEEKSVWFWDKITDTDEEWPLGSALDCSSRKKPKFMYKI